MNVYALLVAGVIAAIATAVWAVVSGTWSWRSALGMFLFALSLLLLPGFIH